MEWVAAFVLVFIGSVCISMSQDEFIAEQVREMVMNGMDWQNTIVYCLGVMHIYVCVCVCVRERENERVLH